MEEQKKILFLNLGELEKDQWNKNLSIVVFTQNILWSTIPSKKHPANINQKLHFVRIQIIYAIRTVKATSTTAILAIL